MCVNLFAPELVQVWVFKWNVHLSMFVIDTLHGGFHAHMTDYIPTTTAFVMAHFESDNTRTTRLPSNVLILKSYFWNGGGGLVRFLLIQTSMCSKR